MNFGGGRKCVRMNDRQMWYHRRTWSELVLLHVWLEGDQVLELDIDPWRCNRQVADLLSKLTFQTQVELEFVVILDSCDVPCSVCKQDIEVDHSCVH